jgi:hypothetical protein
MRVPVGGDVPLAGGGRGLVVGDPDLGELRGEQRHRQPQGEAVEHHAHGVEPGDVVATGTPSGVAAAREGQPWLEPGDRVRVEIDALGAIENEIVQEQLTDDQALAA